jgi:hypothetical protein
MWLTNLHSDLEDSFVVVHGVRVRSPGRKPEEALEGAVMELGVSSPDDVGQADDDEPEYAAGDGDVDVLGGIDSWKLGTHEVAVAIAVLLRPDRWSCHWKPVQFCQFL